MEHANTGGFYKDLIILKYETGFIVINRLIRVRSVRRRSGKTRFIKDTTDWERGVLWTCVSAAWQTTQDKVP